MHTALPSTEAARDAPPENLQTRLPRVRYTRFVRGDSLRDFYAKTLALAGLSLLAGVGALVDYWPVTVSLPPVSARASLLPPPVDPSTIAREPIVLAQGIASDSSWSPAPKRRPTQVAVSGTDVVPLPSLDELPSLNELAAPFSPMPFLPEPVAIVAVNTATSHPDPVGAPSPPSSFSGSDVDALMSAAGPDGPVSATLSGVGADEDDGGLITGAFKKTGSSLVRTGARTGASLVDAGASIVDAMRFVSGAVRRALPTD